jgi:hypothetical protein
LIDEINREWQAINALMGMVAAIGEIADQPDPSDAEELIVGIAAVARIVREKAETMDRNASALFQAWRLEHVTGGER